MGKKSVETRLQWCISTTLIGVGPNVRGPTFQRDQQECPLAPPPLSPALPCLSESSPTPLLPPLHHTLHKEERKRKESPLALSHIFDRPTWCQRFISGRAKGSRKQTILLYERSRGLRHLVVVFLWSRGETSWNIPNTSIVPVPYYFLAAPPPFFSCICLLYLL